MLTASIAANGEASFLDVVPFTLVAGLFLSNFPEALSSSASMLDQGWPARRIFLMWFAVMVVTAAGAGLGYLAAGVLDHADVRDLPTPAGVERRPAQHHRARPGGGHVGIVVVELRFLVAQVDHPPIVSDPCPAPASGPVPWMWNRTR